jgi:hypothetical protein
VPLILLKLRERFLHAKAARGKVASAPNDYCDT